MEKEVGIPEHVDVYDAWWNRRRPTRAWAARYDDEDRYDRVKELLAARAAKQLAERNAKAERERLEREAQADRLRARRSGGVAAVLLVIAILALASSMYSIRQRSIAVTAESSAKAAESSAIASAKKATIAENKAVALETYIKKLGEQRVRAMSERNAKLQEQRNIAQTESDLAHRYSSELETTSEGGNLGRMAGGLWANGDQRVAGLLGADAYALDKTGVAARESLLESAVLPGALGAVALPPWNLGAVAGGGLEFAVLVGQRQSSYGQPIVGSLVTVDAASLAVRSRTADVHASFVCGFDSIGRVVIATGDRLDLWDLGPAGGAERVGSLHAGPVQALACSPRSETAYYVDGQGRLREAGFSGASPITVGLIPGRINGLVLSTAGRFAAVTTTAGDVRLFDLSTRRLLVDKRLLKRVDLDCLAAAGCAGAVAVEDTGGHYMSWYDQGHILARTIDGSVSVTYPCPAASCDHPTLIYLGGSGLPYVVTQSVFGFVSTKKQYEKTYDDIAGMSTHSLWDRELREYATPYNPDTAGAPNPLGSGLEVGALVPESAPLIGRVATSQWIGSYALRGHDLVLPGDHGYITYDLDRLRQQFVTGHSPSYAIRLRDGGEVRTPDGVLRHVAVAFNYQTGVVQILDVRTDTPTVLFQFKTSPVTVKNNRYQDNVQVAYDARSGIVTFLSDDALRRFSVRGRLISALSQSQILRMAQLNVAPGDVTWELTQLGNFVVLHVRSQSDVMIDAAGRIIGRAYTIGYVSADETRAFGSEEKGTHNSRLTFDVPSWDISHGGVLPISSNASYLGLAHDGSLLAYYDSTQSDKIQIYDMNARTLFRYHMQSPPNEAQYSEFAFSADGRYLLVHYKGDDDFFYTAIYALDPTAWMRSACLMSGKPLSVREFQENVGTQIPYIDACAPYAAEMYRW